MYLKIFFRDGSTQIATSVTFDTGSIDWKLEGGDFAKAEGKKSGRVRFEQVISVIGFDPFPSRN